MALKVNSAAIKNVETTQSLLSKRGNQILPATSEEEEAGLLTRQGILDSFAASLGFFSNAGLSPGGTGGSAGGTGGTSSKLDIFGPRPSSNKTKPLDGQALRLLEQNR